jgi:hypothetical protein
VGQDDNGQSGVAIPDTIQQIPSLLGVGQTQIQQNKPGEVPGVILGLGLLQVVEGLLGIHGKGSSNPGGIIAQITGNQSLLIGLILND